MTDYAKPDRNLLTANQVDIEISAAGWTQYQCTLARVTSEAFRGTASLEATLTASPAVANAAKSLASPVVGTPYTVQARVKGPVGKQVRIGIRFGGGANPLSLNYASYVDCSGDWQYLKKTAAVDYADRNVLYLSIDLVGVAGDKFYVDAVQLEQAFVAHNWLLPRSNGTLGSTAGADANDPTWNGQGLKAETNDYVDLGSGITIPGAITLQAILCPTTQVPAGNWERIIQRAGADSRGFSLRADNNRFLFQVRSVDPDDNAQSDTDFVAGTWYRVTGRCDGVNLPELIVDGVKQTAAHVFDGAGDGGGTGINLFRRANEDSYYFDGIIAYVLLYDRALADAEIAWNDYYLRELLYNERGILLAA